MLWNNNSTVSLLGYSSSHIDVLFPCLILVHFFLLVSMEILKQNCDFFLGIFRAIYILCLTYLGLLQVILMRSYFRIKKQDEIEIIGR